MQLEDYFNFLAPDDIRLKGSRIGVESILYEYIFRAQTPEEIVQRFPTLSLEQVYATLLYYHHKKEEMDKYMTEYIEWGRRMREEQERNPSPAVVRLNELRKQRQEQQRLAAQGAEQP
jgi:uncharacterized protein (DUF433 family)